ncbi:hypothetical protein B0H16DRAFT_1319529 [Mycena metata]|uniref:Reverse transcriptase zinc-binding domain-containing protein n=1 Tax=Mycena metata TaxID=1033252 RepID=A0AAD7IRQ3_9AGAR|nr:hypothetical protein B0H16DRAFT_1319529 [Mycena metata]
MPDAPEIAQIAPLVPDEVSIAIFAVAGATDLGGTADARAGAGIVSRQSGTQEITIRVPESLSQNTQNAEIIGALLASKYTPTRVNLKIETRQSNILKAMTTKLPVWEDKGWIEVPNAQSLQALAASLRGRTATTTLAVKSSGEVEEAHSLARAGARRQDTDHVDLHTPDRLQLRGAKLSALTQGLAYRGIKALKQKVNRKATDENVLSIQQAVKSTFKKTPTTKMIWKSIRNKDISRQVRNFLWKTLHGAHRVGKFWEHIPEMGDRATCQHCGVIETMEHILVECTRPGRAEIWALAEAFWRKKDTTWPAVSFGGLMGAALGTFAGEKGKDSPSTARLYRILMTDSMYLIWKIRCEVVIKDNGVAKTTTEIHNRWVALINERLEIDRNLTNHMRFGKQNSLPPSLVLETWKGTLFDEAKLPQMWLREPEVLVGILPIRSRRSPSQPVGRRGRNR